MKNYIISFALLLLSTNILACAGGDYWDGMWFYNLFYQTNISGEEYYPFLRDDDNTFYREDYSYSEKEEVPQGNILLWLKLLPNWDKKDIEKAIYEFDSFDWSNKNTAIEKSAQTYLAFANTCSDAVSFRSKYRSWNYNDISQEEDFDPRELLTKANQLVNNENNAQLKARYYYQIIRLLHYSKAWDEAIAVYNNNVKDQFEKDEIYYYIVDQIAGCYYSTNDYEKAAYLFVKVFNKSYDRKKSAFCSFNFCARKGAEGKKYYQGINDEKDFLILKSLSEFADKITTINQFIALDANDKRVELLFMRALNNVERNIWPKDFGLKEVTLPDVSQDNNYEELLSIAEKQSQNAQVSNKDFWQLASSYLSFIAQDYTKANQKLITVQSYPNQKQVLQYVYTAFSWTTITKENETQLANIIEDNANYTKDGKVDYGNQEDWLKLILDKTAHTYYKSHQLAKAFLIHNYLETCNKLNSIELLNDLEDFYYKGEKSAFEQMLLNQTLNKTEDFMAFVHYQKGIYFLKQAQPDEALQQFMEGGDYANQPYLPAALFSNNRIECFNCESELVMEDEVYKADVFSFIQPSFSHKELAEYLLHLEELCHDERQWKQKLANYLLGNYYFNICNTGYYRGIINHQSNCCHYNYFDYNMYQKKKNTAEEIIKNSKGYNLQTIYYRGGKYFGLSDVAQDYYYKTIDLSTDKELNARCLYLIAKCELNYFYNNGSDDYIAIGSGYFKLKLPKYQSFKTLYENYSETKFYAKMIEECSYFNLYIETLE